MQVYLAGSMTHMDDPSMQSWTDEVETLLSFEGIDTVRPALDSAYREEYNIDEDAAKYVLTQRDKWHVIKSDVVLANFTGSTKGSIGTSIEIGWADGAGVPVVAVIPEGNIHEHPMILSTINYRAYDLATAVRVVAALGGRRV